MAVLSIVSTPIGNREDITYRAVRVLREVDAIVCEDTRETRKLLDYYKIRKPLYSFHERSSERELTFILSLIASGKNIAYVTDAGTPGIADPGNKLVREIAKTQSHEIISLPGPSSLTAAISLCGFNMREFRFFGFLPHKKGRQTKIREIVASDVPVVLFESKYRIQKLFDELLKVGTGRDLPLRDDVHFNLRQCIVANDLTKKFETVYRGTIEEVSLELQKNSPRGEFVVVIDGRV